MLSSYYNIGFNKKNSVIQEYFEVYGEVTIEEKKYVGKIPTPQTNTIADIDYEKRYDTFRTLYTYYNYCIGRLNDIQGICKCRAGEGFHINKSIETMRNHIFTLLKADKQNRSATYPQCTHGLFPVLQNRDNDVLNPVQQPGPNMNAMQMATSNDTNINIVVFGVFNNSPPKDKVEQTLYVDINHLKYLYNCYHINQQYKLDTVSKSKIPTVLRIFLKDYLNEKTIKEGITNELERILDLDVTSLNVEQVEIYKKIQEYVNNLKKQITIPEIKRCIEMIQRENNTSPLGTLEFMDHMSKMNLEIKPVCRTSNDIINGFTKLEMNAINKPKTSK
jgi:hypothetical protein